jgi:hypothetical protein
VPKNLSVEQKAKRLEICQDLLGSTGAIWQGKTVCSERSVPVALCPLQIPRALARNGTWDAVVRHRPEYSCSHVAVCTISFRYEYQPLNKLWPPIHCGLFHDTHWQRVGLHDKSTGKYVAEVAVANAAPRMCVHGLQKPKKNAEQTVFRPSPETDTYRIQVYSVAATPNCSVLLLLTL